MCELLSWPWPAALLKQPLIVRLGLCIGSFSICLALYLLTGSYFYSGSLMAIPMSLCAWLFIKKGACGCFFSYLTVAMWYNTQTYQSIAWPLNQWLSLAGDATILFAIGATLVSLRVMLKKEANSRQQAEESERKLAQAYVQQQQLNQIKTQFIMNVNHEFRIPLAAAYSYFELLQLMLEENGQLERSTHATYIKNALHYCEELRIIVNNMLDSITIINTQKPVAVSDCPVAEIVRNTCERNETFQKAQHRIQVYVPADLSVRANAHYLRNVLHQLLSNAIKFTPATSPILIEGTVNPYNDQEVCISIQDFGPGIPPEEQSSLFERFARLQRDIAGTVRGTGLGLYISKHLIDTMQGRIWVESTGRPGEGSCFRFTLPRSQPHHMQSGWPVSITSKAYNPGYSAARRR